MLSLYTHVGFCTKGLGGGGLGGGGGGGGCPWDLPHPTPKVNIHNTSKIIFNIMHVTKH